MFEAWASILIMYVSCKAIGKAVDLLVRAVFK